MDRFRWSLLFSHWNDPFCWLVAEQVFSSPTQTVTTLILSQVQAYKEQSWFVLVLHTYFLIHRNRSEIPLCISTASNRAAAGAQRGSAAISDCFGSPEMLGANLPVTLLCGFFLLAVQSSARRSSLNSISLLCASHEKKLLLFFFLICGFRVFSEWFLQLMKDPSLPHLPKMWLAAVSSGFFITPPYRAPSAAMVGESGPGWANELTFPGGNFPPHNPSLVELSLLEVFMGSAKGSSVIFGIDTVSMKSCLQPQSFVEL